MAELAPPRMNFQWHLTDQCNLRCKHCYQDEYQYAGPALATLLGYLDNMWRFVQQASKGKANFKSHINITGGEPFLRPDLLELLTAIRQKTNFSFGVLSNGLLLPPKGLEQLKLLKPKFVQLSLEGGHQLNDEIRGQGSTEGVIKALKAYRKLNIPVMISFTANAKNYHDFPAVVQLARKQGAYKVWTDRYLPISERDDLLLSTDQLREFFHIIKREQEKSKLHILSKTEVSAHRALQFLVSGGKPYQCSAGKTLLAILPNGDVLPCRRMPQKIGNLEHDEFTELYFNNQVLQGLRNASNIDEKCAACYYKYSCNGGLKCLTYAMTGTHNKQDPNCWI